MVAAILLKSSPPFWVILKHIREESSDADFSKTHACFETELKCRHQKVN